MARKQTPDDSAAAARPRRASKRQDKNRGDAAPVQPAAAPARSWWECAKSAWERFDAARHGALRLHLILVTAISFLQPYAVGWFESAALPSEPWPFYWAVLKTTAPLTIGLALWVILVVGTYGSESDGGYVMFMGLIGGLILTVAARIGNALGAQQVELIEPIGFLGPLNAMANALASYLRAYRGTMFLSSLGVAVYVGYVAHRIMHIELAPAPDNAEQERRAA